MDRFGIFSTEIGNRDIPEEIPVLKYGTNTYRKSEGRNEFQFSEEDADNVIKEFERRGLDVVIDYNHQTLKGEDAPSAGWIDRLEKTKDGLVAKIKYWTNKAKNYLQEGEYRYFSPVVKFSRTGKNVAYLHSVALTNTPALDRIPALVMNEDDESGRDNDNKRTPTQNEKEQKEMKELITLLALAEGSDEQAILAKVQELLGIKSANDEFLKLHGVDKLEALTEKIKGLVPAEEKAKLEVELKKRDADSAVLLAMSEGKVTEAMKPWATAYAEKDLAGFAEWCKVASKIVPDGKVPQQKTPEADQTIALTENEKKICVSMGIKEEDFVKAHKASK